MKLALMWNRFDIASKLVLTGQENFNVEVLMDLMKMALDDNKPKFVEYVLEKNLDLNKFLGTYKQKYSLKNFEDKEFLVRDFFIDGFSQNYPSFYLFVWALITNKIEIAKIIWKFSEYQVSTAIYGYYLLKRKNKKLKNSNENSKYCESILKEANEFEDMACYVLNTIDNRNKDIVNYVILIGKIPYFQRTCVEMAFEVEAYKFIALPAIQKLLGKIWLGNIVMDKCWEQAAYWIACSTFGVFAPFLKYEPSLTKIFSKLDKNSDENLKKILQNETENDGAWDFQRQTNNDINNDENESCLKRLKTSYTNFYWSPKVCFLYETIAFILFLVCFSYMILCEFEFGERKKVKFLILNTEMSVPNKTQICIEVGLVSWVTLYFIEELRQLIFSKQGRSLKTRIKAYLLSRWNYIDMIGCLLFFIGLGLRLSASFKLEYSLFIAARIVFAIDLSAWYLRLLHVSMMFKSLGPKLIMISKMIKDLSFFFVFVLIFVILFGVTTQATMYPNSKFNTNLFTNVIYNAYWPIYGDIRILEELNSVTRNTSAENKITPPETYGAYYSLIVLVLYMIIANVILMNVLIAMFSNRFKDIHENTDMIWKFQNYELVTEYKSSMAIPPPISFILRSAYFLVGKPLTNKSNTSLNIENPKLSPSLEYALSLEKRFAEEYLYNKKRENKMRIEHRLFKASEKLKLIEKRINLLNKTNSQALKKLETKNIYLDQQNQ